MARLVYDRKIPVYAITPLSTEKSRKLKNPLLVDGYNDIFLREQIDLRSPFPNTLVSFFRAVEHEYKTQPKEMVRPTSSY